jgi:hypothetical protein
MEMTEIGVAFEILAEGQNAPPKWKMVTGHLVWDLKMDFTRKASPPGATSGTIYVPA